MPRIGTNPSRGKTVDYQPARTTVAVLVYAPHQAGYFQSRGDVTKATIESILANTQEPFDLLVFDNGSSPEMVDYLEGLYERGAIDYLILSKHNIGKLNALNIIFNAAPGEIVAYTDDDVFHLPGWLSAHLEIIDTYPNVGAVTGFYIRQRVGLSSESTVLFANTQASTGQPRIKSQCGLLIPRKWEEEYLVNTGRTWEQYQAETAGMEDILVEYQGLEAWVSAHHFQMVCPKHVIKEVLADMLLDGWSDQVMGRMVEMDDRMDAKGYLRLCTKEQTMRLMGNAISEDVAELAQVAGIAVQSAEMAQKPKGLLSLLTRNRAVRFLMQSVVNKFYQWLNQ
jgi:hypothetical protein